VVTWDLTINSRDIMGIYWVFIWIYGDMGCFLPTIQLGNCMKLQTTTDTTCLPARSLSALSHSWKDHWKAQIEI
jgi:hypothetical protein